MNTPYRVGYDDEGTYVWDGSMQPPHKRICILWSLEQKRYDDYGYALVKAYVKPVTDANAINQAIEAYKEWIKSCEIEPASSAIALNAKTQEEAEIQFEADQAQEAKIAEEAEKLRLISEISLRHDAHLKRFGINNNERRRVVHQHRITWCWNCKRPLDNDVDLEHIYCKWIICPACGACGCGKDQVGHSAPE